MSIDQLKLLGEGPYPMPIKQFLEVNNIYLNTEICIIQSKSAISFPDRTHHVHDSYEFTIPLTTMPYVNIENKCYYAEKNSIIAFNSCQAHGPYNPMPNIHLLSINADNDTLNEIAYSIYGRSNVCFKQGSYAYTDELKTLINLFIEEYKNSLPGRKLILKHLSTQIIVHFLRQIGNNMPLLISTEHTTAKKNIDNAIEYMRSHYDEDVSLEEAAKQAHLTTYHFIKVFKAYTSKTPYEYITQLRLLKAKELLSSHNLSITDIYSMCGFNSLSNFTTFFRKRVGVSPSEYRKILQNR